MHETIRRFGIDGKINDDSDFGRLRSQYESLILHQMRDLGYVPVLDLGTHWSTERIHDEDCYAFTLSIYGVRVGKKQSWNIEGMSNGRAMSRPTPPNKSKPAS